MAPYPEEIDVFSVPHSRMKQLVDVYCKKLTCTDFSDYVALESLLHDLHQTFCEFKSHEQIENKYIMKKLKKRLKSMSIHDAAVCNCHSDNRLSDMLALVEDGYLCTSKSESERINFGIKLQNAMKEFTGIFLPHMKEEEEVFQPMLMKYFGYEELKCLKEQVIEEHSKWRVCDREKVSWEEEASDLKLDDVKSLETESTFQFPPEVITHIFSFLSPRDLLKCSEVSHSWYEIAHYPVLWKNLYPCYWARGIWQVYDIDYKDMLGSPYQDNAYIYEYYHDEDADIDESSESEYCSSEGSNIHDEGKKILCQEIKTLTALVKHLLPQVGSGVQKMVLSTCRGLTSSLLHSILLLCPNVVYLDLSYTNIADSAFKGLKDNLSCLNLQYVDLSGCKRITDLGLFRLADCLAVLPPHLPDGRENLRDVYLEDCDRLSLCCLSDQYMVDNCCEIEDSGHILQRESNVCSQCDTDDFCASICMWKKNGVMCHLARLSQQCPYMNACQNTNSAKASNSVLRTTTTILNDTDSDNVVTLESSNRRNFENSATGVLRYLNLSGCWEVTDEGLRCLAEAGLLNHLEFLDVSGCWYLTGPGLCDVVNLAPSLLPENIYYCNRIEDGPYPDSANGCQNLENDFRACCCSRII